MRKSKLFIAAAVMTITASLGAVTPAHAAALTPQHSTSQSSFGDCMCQLFRGMCPPGDY